MLKKGEAKIIHMPHVHHEVYGRKKELTQAKRKLNKMREIF